MMLPLWVRPADSFRSAVMPAQNSRASALGKRSKGPISAAMIRLQISPMPGTLCRMQLRLGELSRLRAAMRISRRSRSRCRSTSSTMSRKSANACCCAGPQQVTVSQQPALGAGAVELRAVQVGRVEHRLHGVLAAAEQSAELPPVPAELAELHQRRIGDEAQRTLAARQAGGRCPAASLGSFFRRLPRRLASSVASAMSIRSTHVR